MKLEFKKDILKILYKHLVLTYGLEEKPTWEEFLEQVKSYEKVPLPKEVDKEEAEAFYCMYNAMEEHGTLEFRKGFLGH